MDALRINKVKLYTESNLINKLHRHYLVLKFNIRFEFAKFLKQSRTFYTHPKCNIEHITREDLAKCNNSDCSMFTESKEILS